MRAAILLACVFLLGPGLLPAQTLSALETAREFYAWYVPIALKSDGLAVVLKQRPDFLTASLSSALRADRAAAEKNADEIVGLDGDPFFDSQDPCERYDVGEPKLNGSQALIPVYETCRGKRNAQPRVTVELLLQNKKWKIANLRYRAGRDLITDLRQLRDEREKSKQ